MLLLLLLVQSLLLLLLRTLSLWEILALLLRQNGGMGLLTEIGHTASWQDVLLLLLVLCQDFCIVGSRDELCGG